MQLSIHDYLTARDQNFNELKLLARFSRGQLCEILDITDRTLRRWERNKRYPRQAIRQLALYAGYFVQPGWTGFCIDTSDGLMYHPQFKAGLSPEGLTRCWYIAANLAHWERQNPIAAARYKQQSRAAPPV